MQDNNCTNLIQISLLNETFGRQITYIFVKHKKIFNQNEKISEIKR